MAFFRVVLRRAVFRRVAFLRVVFLRVAFFLVDFFFVARFFLAMINDLPVYTYRSELYLAKRYRFAQIFTSIGLHLEVS